MRYGETLRHTQKNAGNKHKYKPSHTPFAHHSYTTHTTLIQQSHITKTTLPTGYVKAYSDELIPDVVDRMYNSSGSSLASTISGVALVYDRDTSSFAGVFTERDYVLWSSSRVSVEEKGLDGLLQYTRSTSSTIGSFVTPASEVVTSSMSDNASRLLETMRKSNIRHLLLTATGGPAVSESDVEGVVSMRRILNVVVQDERLSMRALAAKFPNLVSGGSDPVAAFQAEQASYANELAKAPGVGREDFIKFGTAATCLAGAGLFLSQSQVREGEGMGRVGGRRACGYALRLSGVLTRKMYLSPVAVAA